MTDKNLKREKQDRSEDLRKRLRQLRVTHSRPSRVKEPETPREVPATTSDSALNALLETTPEGECVVITNTYPEKDIRVVAWLQRWMSTPPELLAAIGFQENLNHVMPENFLFIDTETTGLGGSGIIAFQVGIGRIIDQATFEITQYFLRDPSEEPDMLEKIRGKIDTRKTGLITFNGRTFDVPLLDGRGVMNRIPMGLKNLPHLDLMGLSRRLWYRRLGSYSLSTIEKHILDIQRSGADVPGFLIPGIYHEYLRNHDVSEILRVLYHNEIDILSLLALGAEIADLVGNPGNEINPIDRLSLAKLYKKTGENDKYESLLQTLIDSNHEHVRAESLELLGFHLKRNERRPEAQEIWLRFAEEASDLKGHEELSKYHEWYTNDLQEALKWTEEALDIINKGRFLLEEEVFLHRRDRLRRKINKKERAGD